MRHFVFFVSTLCAIAACGGQIAGGDSSSRSDPSTPNTGGGAQVAAPDEPPQSSPPPPATGTGSSGGSVSSGGASSGASACVMPAGATPRAATLNVDGEDCVVTNAMGETQAAISGHLWVVFICATCPSLGAVSVAANGDDQLAYPQGCNYDGGAPPTAVELSVCGESDAGCYGYSYDARAPGTCRITEGPTEANQGTPVGLTATVVGEGTRHDVVASVWAQ